jgi:DNA-binding response OmpR family regulator
MVQDRDHFERHRIFDIARHSLFTTRILAALDRRRPQDPSIADLIAAESAAFGMTGNVPLVNQSAYVTAIFMGVVWLWDQPGVRGLAQLEEKLEERPPSPRAAARVVENTKPREVTNVQVLRAIRNACAHGRVEETPDEFLFTDINPKDRSDRLKVGLSWPATGAVSESLFWILNDRGWWTAPVTPEASDASVHTIPAPPPPLHVLVVDPGGKDLLAPVVSELRRLGHGVEFEVDASGVLARLERPRFQVVIAPYDLDDPPVAKLVERLRRSGKLVPFAVAVDARGLNDEPNLLAAGADLVVDAGAPAVAVARLEALVRLATYPAAARRIDMGGIVIDESTHTVEIDGEPVEFPPSEVRLLASLAVRLSHIVSRAELIALVWGEGADVTDNALESVVKRVRRRLGQHAARLASVRLRGYVLSPPPA